MGRGVPASLMERLVGIGVTWKLAGQVAIQLIRLLTVAVLARLLTPADYGAAAIAIVLATFAPTVADMGIGSALVQAETRHEWFARLPSGHRSDSASGSSW